ncbi:hypothetical protein JP28_12540 [Gallibacterium anatis]|nr:hypothetical protein JP28_12540 [Gallibacterium anatis]KGQ47123.1 hypothetical protein IO46_13430 [Gallibacterium anatis]
MAYFWLTFTIRLLNEYILYRINIENTIDKKTFSKYSILLDKQIYKIVNKTILYILFFCLNVEYKKRQ